MTTKESTLKIRADRADLADAVSWVAQAVPKKHTVPALGGVKISAEAEVVTLQCFDYESSHSAVVACDVPSAGECLVSAHLLREILSALKGSTVELALDGERLTIACGKSTYRLGVMRLEDYPSLPKFPKHAGKVARDDLADLIGAVEHAAGRDDLVPVLTAVHLVGDVGRLRAQTTDRFRIADAGTSWSVDGATGKGPRTFDALIPATALTGAIKGLAGPLDVGHDGHLFGLSDGSRTVTTRCLDEDYPKITSLLNNARGDLIVTVDATALAGALKRASLVADERAPLRLEITADEIAITSDSDKGAGAEYVPCKASGEIETLYNGMYLAAALLAVGGTAQLAFSGPNKPVLVTPADGDRDVRTLAMPRRLTS